MTKNWIAKATGGNKGALRRTLHVKAGQTIPVAKLRAAAEKPGITGKRASGADAS